MPIGATFIIASKNCSTKPLPAVISKIFKVLFEHVKNSYDKSTFYSSYKKLRVVEAFFPIIEKLNRPIKISLYNFRTFYTTISYNLLIKVLSEIINFVFKWKFPSKVGFSATSIYWASKGLAKRYFTENNLTETIMFLIKYSYLTIENMVFKEDIGIPTGIDPAPFLAIMFFFVLFFFSLGMFKTLPLKNQIEHNTMLLVDS